MSTGSTLDEDKYAGLDGVSLSFESNVPTVAILALGGAGSRWQPSSGDAVEFCRLIVREGAYLGLASDVSSIQLYFPPQSGVRDVKIHKTIHGVTRDSKRPGVIDTLTLSDASSVLAAGSSFLAGDAEPPKSDPWLLKMQFESKIIGIDITGTCAVFQEPEKMAYFA